MPRTHPWRILLLLLALSLALTWPLLPHILTHVPGDGIDDPALAWNLWWAKDSWVDRAGEGGLFHNPFDGDGMFYPISINLAFYTLTLLNGALSVPLQSAFSLILASNLILLSSFVIGGFGAYLLAMELLGGWPGAGGEERGAKGATRTPQPTLHLTAFLAALIYAFASAKLFYVALGQFNIASSQWLPFIALYLARGLRSPWRWRNGFMLGLFLLFQTWAELTFGTFGVLLIAIVVGVIVLVALATALIARFRRTDQPASDLGPIAWNGFRSAAIAAVMFIVGLIPYLANMLPDMLANGDFLVEGGGFSDIFSVDLLGLWLPTQLHPLFGDIIRTLADDSILRADGSQLMVNKGQHLYLGYVVMALALVGLWSQRRKLWVWGVAALTGFFLLVSLGPFVRINGYETNIPGLFPLLLKIPFFQANRYPSRYSVLILLGAAILAALGALAILRRLRPRGRRWAAAGLAVLILLEHLSVPLPLSDFRLPPAYAAVVADPRPGAVLDLPIGWRNGFNVFGKADTVIMFTQWYQTFHAKPRLGGNTSRNPEQKFQYFMENPVIGVLAALQDGRPVPPADFSRAQTLAPDLLRFLNIHTVLVHRPAVPAGFEQTLTDLFPLDFVEAEGEIARYEARWPEERLSVTLAADDPELLTYLREGWGTPVRADAGDAQAFVWAGRPLARMMLPAVSQPAQASLNLFVPGAQTIILVLDGQEAARQDLTPGLNTLSLTLPASDDGFRHFLDIRATRTFEPGALSLSSRQIGATGVRSPVHITVRSAGKDTGDFGHIYVDGVDVSPNRRGYNLAALDPSSGAVLDAVVFDTHDPRQAPRASAEMAAWINALPAGVIVAGAVRDAAALSLDDAAVGALRTLGVSTDVRGSLRRAHAFVGVKNHGGAAAEASSELWPATVSVGDGLIEPTPSFALLDLSWRLR